MTLHCGDNSPHGQHIWYEPNPFPGKTTQVQHACDGTPDPDEEDSAIAAKHAEHAADVAALSVGICDWERAGYVCDRPATTTWTRTGHRDTFGKLMDPTGVERLSRCDKHPMGEHYGWVPRVR